MTILPFSPALLPNVLALVDNDDARNAGIYLNYNELTFYLTHPWLHCYCMYHGQECTGFAVLDMFERPWGRGRIMEFYISPVVRARVRMSVTPLAAYRFYKELLKRFGGCHRITAQVKAKNMNVCRYLMGLGWNMEATLKKYSPKGDTYFQMVKYLEE